MSNNNNINKTTLVASALSAVLGAGCMSSSSSSSSSSSVSTSQETALKTTSVTKPAQQDESQQEQQQSKKPEEEEKEGREEDYWSRQEGVPHWDDSVISQQVALVLGTGGIGSSVALCLGRLGVKEIILVDMDTVDASNLNRQLLFGKSDVGDRKVDAAKRTLDQTHASVRTKVTTVHANIIEEWGCKIVPLLQRDDLTVVLNACDYGGDYDLAVQSVCCKRGLPYVTAASYAHHADFELFDSKKSCLGCRLGRRESTHLANNLNAEHTLKQDHLCFVPADEKPSTGSVGSSVLCCEMAGAFCVNQWVNGVLFRANKEKIEKGEINHNCFGMCELSCYHSGTPSLDVWPVEHDSECSICGDVEPCLRPEACFALAFGAECVTLGSAPDGSASFNPVDEAPEFRKERIGKFREKVAPLLDKAPFEPSSVLKDLAAQPGTARTFNSCPPAVPLQEHAKEFLQTLSSKSSSSSPTSAASSATSAAATSTSGTTTSSQVPVPKSLQEPLIKCANGHVHALRSGMRSCILPAREDKYLRSVMDGSREVDEKTKIPVVDNSFGAIRLKGAGCVRHDTVAHTKEYPFPTTFLDGNELVKNMKEQDPSYEPRLEIRGCCFDGSVIREQLMSRKIADMLAPSGYLLGNYPAAVWEYAKNEKMEPREIYGDVRKFCGCFFTLGDKRAETHVMTGVELVLALLVGKNGSEAGAASNEKLARHFPAERKSEKALSKATNLLAPFENKQVAIDAEKVLGADKDFLKWERESILSQLKQISGKDAAGPTWASLWNQTVEQLCSLVQKEGKESSSSSLFCYLYTRLGYEMGFFEGSLNQSDFSWGLFFDHDPCSPHNNAHPNNFLVIGKTIGLQKSFTQDDVGKPLPQYLAACDFDMAYCRDEFVNTFDGKDAAQSDIFDSNCEWEAREMLGVLGGDDASSTGIVKDAVATRLSVIMSSSSSSSSQKSEENEEAKKRFEATTALRYLLRDALLNSWKQGMEDGKKYVKNGAKEFSRPKIENVAGENFVRLLFRLSLMASTGINH